MFGVVKKSISLVVKSKPLLAYVLVGVFVLFQ
jgi:hypothetical protein